MDVERPGWRRFTRAEFRLEFSYPAVTPQGQAVERDDEPFRDHTRVHLSSADRQELYVEVVRFEGLVPEDEYEQHRPYLERRFGGDAITPLTQTSLQGQRAWTYGFRWDEGGRAMERAVVLLRLGRDTYRVIYDPQSQLNEEIIATLTIAA